MDVAYNTVMFEVMSGIVQGVLIGTGLTLIVGVLLTRAVAMSASTRFAVWFACLFVAAILTVAPLGVRPATEPLPFVDVVHSASSPVAAKIQEISAAPVPRQIEEPWVTVPVDAELPDVALGIWLLVFGVLLLRLLWGYRALVRLKKRSKPAPPELAARLDAWMEQSQCRRPVQLLVSNDARCPLAAGFRGPAVIIPESLLLQLNAMQLDHIVLHELAHLRRYDDWNTLAQRLVRAALFFHPGIHWISHRLEFEREVACDDSVLAVTSEARTYAESLSKVAEITPWRRAPILASGALFRKRQIFRRVQTLLNSARDKRPRVSQVTVALVLLVLIGIGSELAQLPAFVAMLNDSAYQRVRWSSNGRNIEMDMSGDVEFTDDDTSVAHLSPGAFLRVEERTGWSSRRIEFRAVTSGEPEIRYRVNGAERPLDDAGRAWISNLLPRIIREHGVNADERARRILTRGGPAALLEEVDRISSDHARSRYLMAAFDSGKLDADALRQAAPRVRRISSDDEKANLLIEVAPLYLRQQLHGPLFDALDTISSDHDKARTIRAILSSPSLDASAVTDLIRLAKRIASDSERAGVLTSVLAERTMTAAEMDEVCGTASGMSSDHDKANVLIAASSRLTPACFAAARTISSDHEKRRVLERVLASGVTRETAHAAIATASSISSDHEKVELLIRAAEQYSDDATRALIRKAAEGVTSDEDHRRLSSRLSGQRGE